MYEKREEIFAQFIIDNNCTIRQAAGYFDYSKSTIHNDLSKKLKHTNLQLYFNCKQILDNNFEQKSSRGGQATKLKYLNLKH